MAGYPYSPGFGFWVGLRWVCASGYAAAAACCLAADVLMISVLSSLYIPAWVSWERARHLDVDLLSLGDAGFI